MRFRSALPSSAILKTGFVADADSSIWLRPSACFSLACRPPDTLRGEIIVSLALGRPLHRFRRQGTVAHFLEYLRESRHFWSRGAGASTAAWVSFESLPPTPAHGGRPFLARTCAAPPAIATSTLTAGTTS